MLAKILFDNNRECDRIESMDVKVSNQTNNSPQESGVNTLTSSQICGGYSNKNLNRGKRLPHGGKCGTGHRNLLSPPRLLIGDE